MNDKNFVIIGCNGQLGKALQEKYPNARAVDYQELDMTDKNAIEAFDWTGVTHILNAAAYTNVDGAETPEGRIMCWKINASGVANLVDVARKHDICMIHISTDYVFDGTKDNHKEDEDFSPLSIYGASKATSDILVSGLNKHYILRTSWVIGDGNNFVKTMVGLAAKDIPPTVVHDQIGRLTFTSELVSAIDHLLINTADFGTYNVSNSGESASWADITREIFKNLDRDDLTVSNTTTDEYFAGKENIAPRPLQSMLDLTKIQSAGFESNDWLTELEMYINQIKK